MELVTASVTEEVSKIFRRLFTPISTRSITLRPSLGSPCIARKKELMVRSNVAASSSARSRNHKAEKPAQPAATTGQNDKAQAPDKRPAVRQRPKGAPGVRLWGFVRRHEDAREKTAASELLTHDIAIWYDEKRCRFQVVSDHKIIDDLAPSEFVQFVRALRYSTTQILFKFENRHDGTAGRPLCVWSTPQATSAA